MEVRRIDDFAETITTCKGPKMIKLSVIVLCYRGDRWIGPCIASLEEQTLDRQLYELILADNGGHTASLGGYQGDFQTTVVRFSENYGFTGGNNRALSFARGDVVVLMNQDVLVHHRCLEEILGAFDRFPRAGAISANMQLIHHSREGDTRGCCPETTGLFRITNFGFAQYELVKSKENMLPVSFLSGNALGFRKKILADTDGYLFDERLGSYAEDLDFSLRLARAEKKMFVAKQAIVYHFRGASFSGSLRQMLTKFVHVSSNRLVVYLKNYGIAGFLTRLPLLLSGVALKMGRIDGAARFDWLRFSAGMAVIPLVLLQFGVKTARQSQSPPRTSGRNRLPDEI